MKEITSKTSGFHIAKAYMQMGEREWKLGIKYALYALTSMFGQWLLVVHSLNVPLW